MTKVFRKIFMLFFMLALVAAFGSTAYAQENISFTVSEGTVYWESSYGYGTGRHATVSRENPYAKSVEGEFNVCIDGYSILDAKGFIQESSFDEKNFQLSIPTVTGEQQLMVHIWGADKGGYRLGWIKYTDLGNKNNSNYLISELPEGDEEVWFENSDEKTVDQTVDTLRDEVEADSRIPRESLILADFSGSMSEFQSDVLEKLEGTVGTRYVFAEDIEEFSIDRDIWSYDIGGATDIANALNSVDINKNTHVYILSDLNDNCSTEIKIRQEFEGEITIVYYPNDSWSAKNFFEKVRNAYPNATITGF